MGPRLTSKPPTARHRLARLVEHLTLAQLGSLEAGWRVPAKRCRDWRKAFVLGAGADPTFPLALLRCSPAMAVHVFDARFADSPASDVAVEALSPQMNLHPVAVGPTSTAGSNECCLQSAMSGDALERLDVLAIHETEAVADIVGDMLHDEAKVSLLCLAMRGTPEPERLEGLIADMDAAGYRAVHVAAQPTSWRMTFAAGA